MVQISPMSFTAKELLTRWAASLKEVDGLGFWAEISGSWSYSAQIACQDPDGGRGVTPERTEGVAPRIPSMS
ncbi:hypothetical protein ACWEKR_34590 [Nocardia sp. NPDC004573]